MKAPPNQVFHKAYAGEQVVTADGAIITEGLRVWTNDLEAGKITLAEAEYEWNASAGRYVLWFNVIRDNRPGERGVHQSDDRVARRHPFTHRHA